MGQSWFLFSVGFCIFKNDTSCERPEQCLSFVALGDVFDEASFSPDEIYSTYLQRFKELFHVDKPSEMYVVAGNHDVGFHYA